jgi:aryl-alcohol dehydrogenase-like predicted oxidoreductase
MDEQAILRPLGRSGISVPALGVGTNRWNTSASNEARLRATVTAALDAGMGFFDTAEIYILLASKFAPLPHRLTAAQFASALERTLDRLGRDALDLYYLHFPYSPRGLDTWMRAMADAVREGKIRAVGVSNCNPAQMRAAVDALARYDIPLAANQVHYSLLHRRPERDGVVAACRRMDVALVAYRPIGGGAISSGSSRGSTRSALTDTLQKVAAVHGATVAQVALAWLLARDEHVIAIPGATRPEHVRENAGALSLALSKAESAALDRASAPTPAK